MTNESSKYSTSSRFVSLCKTRKTESIASILLEAIYQNFFSHIDIGTNIVEEDVKIWRENFLPFASKMLTVPVPKSVGPGGSILFEAFGEKPKNKESELSIFTKLWERTSLKNYADAKELWESLGTEEREIYEKFEPIKGIIQSILIETQGDSIPESWPELLSRLGDPEFKDYFEKLKLAIDEWPIKDIKDPEEIKELNESFKKIFKDPESIIEDRLSTCLPLITSWLIKDPDFPRIVLTEFYETLLFYFAVGAKREGRVYDSTQKLIGALLNLGLSREKYKDLLETCADLGKGIGTEQISWALNILEETIINPCPDEEERKLFFNKIFNEIEKRRQYLSVGQILVIQKFDSAPHWVKELKLDVEEKKSKLKKISDNINSIAIYSLTESALNQATEIIKQILPNIKVHTSHDKAGNPRLESYAKTADIFVIVTSSAKHAATEFIQKNRPKDKTTLFAAGKGSSSIIRALEEQYV